VALASPLQVTTTGRRWAVRYKRNRTGARNGDEQIAFRVMAMNVRGECGYTRRSGSRVDAQGARNVEGGVAIPAGTRSVLQPDLQYRRAGSMRYSSTGPVTVVRSGCRVGAVTCRSEQYDGDSQLNGDQSTSASPYPP